MAYDLDGLIARLQEMRKRYGNIEKITMITETKTSQVEQIVSDLAVHNDLDKKGGKIITLLPEGF